MAAAGDFAYLAELIRTGTIVGSVLELGSQNRQLTERGNARQTCERQGLSWTGTDIEDGPDVHFTLDMLDEAMVRAIRRVWDTVLVMNLLEHVYDPIRVLENALLLLRPGGSVVIVGPAIWELHDFPADYWRPMPDFFVEFAQRHRLVATEMHWIVDTRLVPVSALTSGPQKLAPSKAHDKLMHGSGRALWSRVVHRLANTTGRETFFPYAGLGVCLHDRSPHAA